MDYESFKEKFVEDLKDRLSCVLFIVTDTTVHLFFPVRPERGENGYN